MRKEAIDISIGTNIVKIIIKLNPATCKRNNCYELNYVPHPSNHVGALILQFSSVQLSCVWLLMTLWTSAHQALGFTESSIGKEALYQGKGYPLQYSGLENSMDCIVHGVAKSRTWLSNFHSLLTCQCDWIWRWGLQEVIKVKWGHRGGVWSSGTGVLIEEEIPEVCAGGGKAM